MFISTPIEVPDRFDVEAKQLNLEQFMMIFVKSDSQLRQCIVVPFGESRIVGRSSDADVVIDDHFISGMHFEIQNRGEFAKVRDLKSTNKTWVNKVSFTTTKLHSGEEFRAGKTTFYLEWRSQESLGRAAWTSTSPTVGLEPPMLLKKPHVSLPIAFGIENPDEGPFLDKTERMVIADFDPDNPRDSSPFDSFDESLYNEAFFDESVEELEFFDSPNIHMNSYSQTPESIEPVISTVEPELVTKEAALIDIESQPLGSGVTEYRLRSASHRSCDVLKTLSPKLFCYLAVNKMRLGDVQIEGWKQTSNDLFENAPAEIRASDSLLVGSLDPNAVSNDGLSKILASDSTIMLISTLDSQTLLEKQKMAWAWFSRPSVFKQQMVHGSETLAKTLFAGISYALIRDRQSDDLIIYSFADIECLCVGRQFNSSSPRP